MKRAKSLTPKEDSKRTRLFLDENAFSHPSTENSAGSASFYLGDQLNTPSLEMNVEDDLFFEGEAEEKQAEEEEEAEQEAEKEWKEEGEETDVERSMPPFTDVTVRSLVSDIRSEWELPIGEGIFEEARTPQPDLQPYWLADKSLFIEEVIKDKKVILITRPRRFGKTFNLSMLESFFDIKNNMRRRVELFNGLAISNTTHEYLRRRDNQYPVIFLTLKDVRGGRTVEDLVREFSVEMSELYKKYKNELWDTLPEEDRDDYNKIMKKEADNNELGRSLAFLIKCLRYHYNKEVVVLIDEYDTPILSAFNSFEAEEYEVFQEFYRKFLGSALKDNNRNVYKSVITGILHIAGAGLFSGLNNFVSYNAFDVKYSSYFGFTETDMEQFYVDFGIEESDRKEIKGWYNGYRFGSGEIIYNPWSVLSCVWKKKFGCYWTETSSKAEIRDILLGASDIISDGLIDLIQGEPLLATLPKKLDITETTKGAERYFWSLLLSSGYLKIQNVIEERGDELDAYLEIPNKEVLWVYQSVFKNWLEDQLTTHGFRREVLIDYLRAGEIEEFCRELEAFFSRTVGKQDIKSNYIEAFYHGFVLALIGLMMPSHAGYLRSNREGAGAGKRFDLMFEPRDKQGIGFVMEFKRLDPSYVNTARRKKPHEIKRQLKKEAETGLKQIKDMEYALELPERGVEKVALISIAFHGKQLAYSCERKEFSLQNTASKRRRKHKETPRKNPRTELARFLSNKSERGESEDDAAYKFSASPLNDRLPQRKNKKRSVVFNEKRYLFEELPITGEGAGGNCGFTALGPDRDRAIQGLLDRANDPRIREVVGFEIREAFREQTLPPNLQSEAIKQLYTEYSRLDTEFSRLASAVKETILNHHPELHSEISPLPPDELLQWLGQHNKEESGEYKRLNNFRLHSLFPFEDKLIMWSESEEIFEKFVEDYLSCYGRQWLTFLPENHGEARGLLDAIVITQNIPGICVWATDEEGNMREQPSHYYGDIEQGTHILHTDGGTHFNLLLPRQLSKTIDIEDEREHTAALGALGKRGFFSENRNTIQQGTLDAWITGTKEKEDEENGQLEKAVQPNSVLIDLSPTQS